jgi:endo-1,4-beta-xylanase
MKIPGLSSFRNITFACLLLLTGSCLSADNRATGPTTLRQAYKELFLIGAAVNRNEVTGKSPGAEEILRTHYNTLTAENDMKWGGMQPQPDVFDFEAADRYVEFGQKHGLAVIGHTLVWHSQTPAWVFKGPDGKPASRELLLKRMEKHIKTVVGRYRGKIKGWDVVNEAISDGEGVLRKSPWLDIIGEDFILKAFQYAHEADPSAELYYNDYSLEGSSKREKALQVLRKLKSRGARITGVGLQGHYNLKWPELSEIDKTISDFSRLGLKVMITELDVDVLPSAWKDMSADISKNYAADPKLNPYADGFPPAEQARLAKRYADIFAVFMKHRRNISRVTFWGVADGGSWLNNWPVKGRTNYPLIFDRNFQPKPAFDAVLKAPALKK